MLLTLSFIFQEASMFIPVTVHVLSRGAPCLFFYLKKNKAVLRSQLLQTVTSVYFKLEIIEGIYFSVTSLCIVFLNSLFHSTDSCVLFLFSL